jgi:lipopolysaccharide transport system ATP-binding protein
VSDRPVVIVDRVWKKFRRGQRHDSLRDLVPSLLRGGKRRDDSPGEQEFWALQDVSFEVKPGEALGIIGPNGAGKSTALKLLTRLLKPTRGRCEVRGRVGALIEVAGGFHPDLTGRENIFLQGAIMGMRHHEIARRFDDIVDFSGIGAFIDTQAKRYSSGMQARLGFSVAAHLDPDVLFVDEVLSVGDISFQARCIDRMREYIRQGSTVVFVSHNLQAVATLCRRCIVLSGGTLACDDAPPVAFEEYLKAGQLTTLRKGMTAPSYRLLSATFSGGQGSAGLVRPHEKVSLSLEFECLDDAPPANVGLELERTSDLLYVYGATTEELGQPLIQYRRGDRFQVVAEFVAHLARGHYRININIRDSRAARFLFVAESVANFSVHESISYSGVVEPELAITVQELVVQSR